VATTEAIVLDAAMTTPIHQQMEERQLLQLAEFSVGTNAQLTNVGTQALAAGSAGVAASTAARAAGAGHAALRCGRHEYFHDYIAAVGGGHLPAFEVAPPRHHACSLGVDHAR
jgi:predicted N-acetyltransferase YhbS